MISASILQTLKYSDHFDFPLTISEIESRLIGARSSRPQLIHALSQMLKQNQIEQSGDYYFLPGRRSLISRRLKRAQLSSPQLVSAGSIAGKLGHIPGVLAIYLTGSLAMSNSEFDADTDFMVITKSNRLWTTRLLVTLYSEFLGLRRRPGQLRSSGKICLNLYLSPISYLLPPDRRSLYTAYELIQAIPLYDPHDTHSPLLAANSWIKKYLPNYPSPDPAGPGLAGQNNLPAKPGPIGKLIESLAYHLQLLYMRPKITREYITTDSAFFHPNNPAPKV